jgi:CO/xanthine dehydrogenase Mo-binding subunit
MAIGSSDYKIDGPQKVTGQTLFPGDLMPENHLFGKVLFSGRPHARMLRMDLAEAAAVPGVVTILTARDVPVNEYGLTVKDQPVLVGLEGSRPDGEISRWEGDQVAVVIAESVDAAEMALEKIAVDWQELPVLTDPEEAMRDELILHRQHGTNIREHFKIRKGDLAAGWEAADIVIEGVYRFPHQEHMFLQPEAGVGYLDSAGRVTVEIGGQWTHEDQEQIAHALDLPPDMVRVKYPAIGGAFGGKEDMSLQIVLALAAKRLEEMGINRPVKIVWSREESVVGHHKRHKGIVYTKWGVTQEGKLTAVDTKLIFDAGAYNYTSNKVLGNAHLMVSGPYSIPNARVDSYAVYTNNVPAGAFRGFGGPQGAFVAENQMNKIAAALGMDPVELRMKNVLRDGEPSVTQTPLPKGVSLPEVIEKCAQESGWERISWGKGNRTNVDDGPAFQSFRSLPPDPTAVKRGRGFACAFKNVGFSFGFPERCEARIRLFGGSEIERAELYHAGADVGQGSHTVFRQMAAEALSIDPKLIDVIASDTASAGDSGSVSASRMTFMAGNAIIGAAREALDSWRDEERPSEGHYRYVPPTTTMLDAETGKSDPNFSYGYVAEVVEIAIDIETGHIFTERVVCANDVGKAINPTLIEGQIEGAVVQAHGYAITENLQTEGGHILNPRLSTYLIPGISDIPLEVKSVIMEKQDPLGPWGARGMGEMPLIPYAPAVTAALFDATGIWFDEIPLTPYRVLDALKRNRAEIDS